MLYNQAASDAQSRYTVGQHLRALEHCDRDVTVVYHNVYQYCPDPLLARKQMRMPDHLRGEKFDAAIFHYTFLAHHWDVLTLLKCKWAFQWVSDLSCLKVAMPQDEPDHVELLDEWLFGWGTDVVF